MTTRHLSGLFLGIAVSALTAALFFSGPTTSAAKGDRSAPTAPTNLVVTTITETSVTLKWGASSDNSGKLSYKVRITNLANSAYNSLATVSQTQTTYTAKYLATNSPYTFSVHAVDGNGNRSGDSNLASANTLADTTAPTGLALQATVLGPSQVLLTWIQPTDNVNYCCTYGVFMNGNQLTQHLNWMGATEPYQVAVKIRHLTPGSSNSFSVRATDSAGNASTSNTVSVTNPPSSDVLPPTVPTNLHLAQDNSCGEVWLGWNEASDGIDAPETIEYEIYVNGVLSPLPVSAGVDVDFVYATAHGENIFTVKAVDRSGNTSAASAPIKLILWPC